MNIVAFTKALQLPEPMTKHLEKYHEVMAGHASSGYKNKGRGFVLIDWNGTFNMRVSQTGIKADILTFYVTQHSPLVRKLWPKGLGSEQRRLIREYDPKTAFVLVYYAPGFSSDAEIFWRTLCLFNLQDSGVEDLSQYQDLTAAHARENPVSL